MDWFWRLFFNVVLRLPWVEALAARARLYVEAIVFFHQRHPPGSLSPWLERSLCCWSDRMLHWIHTLADAYIFHRAMDLIDVYPSKHRRVVLDDVAGRALSRRQVGSALRQVCRRLETLEHKARQRAALFRRWGWGGVSSTYALSTRIPSGGRGPVPLRKRASALDLLSSKTAPCFARVFSASGPRPSPGMRLMDSAPRDGPALAACSHDPINRTSDPNL